MWVLLDPAGYQRADACRTDCSGGERRHSTTTSARIVSTSSPKAAQKTYSWGANISATVPPTMVEPVDPKAPAKNRAIKTVWMFFPLCTNVSTKTYTQNFLHAHCSCNREEQEPNAAPEVQRLPTKLLAEGRRHQGDDAKTERI